jgi:hypothetical protein
MPYKFEYKKIRLPQGTDKRKKLEDSQYKEIRDLYASGTLSYKAIGDMYGVSKSRIIQIVNPHIEERQKKQFKERRMDGRYYQKEEHKEAIKKHRRYKQSILKSK